MNITYARDFSSDAISQILDNATGDVVFVGDPRVQIDPGYRMFDRMLRVIRDTGAAIVYSDGVGQPRNDYQFGSIRDNFEFGPVMAIAVIQFKPI